MSTLHFKPNRRPASLRLACLCSVLVHAVAAWALVSSWQPKASGTTPPVFIIAQLIAATPATQKSAPEQLTKSKLPHKPQTPPQSRKVANRPSAADQATIQPPDQPNPSPAAQTAHQTNIQTTEPTALANPQPQAFTAPSAVETQNHQASAVASVNSNAAEPAPLATQTPAANTAKRSPAMLLASSSCEKPQYPAASRRANESGQVILLFYIGADGKVQASRVEKSSGYNRLDQAALAALALCSFKPASQDGIPTASWVRLPYIWRLDE